MTIDTESNPPQSLSVRGIAEITEVEGVAPEYAAAARRYLGAEAAAQTLAAVNQPGTRQARIAVRRTGSACWTSRPACPACRAACDGADGDWRIMMTNDLQVVAAPRVTHLHYAVAR